MHVVRPTLAAAAAFALVLLAAAGCEHNNKPTPKEQATERWNAARAGVLLSQANAQYQSGNFEQSRKTVDEALKMMPGNPGLRMLSAKLHIEAGRLEAAEVELKLAREAAPSLAEAHYLSGIVYQRWQKPEAATEFYKSAYERSPAELAYLLAWSEMLVFTDKPADALALLEGKVSYFEHSATIRDAVGQILMQLGRHREAVVAFRNASILAEDDLAIRERLGIALYYNKDHRGAAEALARVVANEQYAKRADLLTVLGECQLQSGNARDARRTFETATQLDPNSASAWRGLGRSALENRDLKRAELSLARAAKVDPTQAETHLLLGYVHLRQDRAQDALRAFQTASRLAPSDTTALCMAGVAYEKLGRTQDAVKCYSRAMSIKPNDDLAARLMAGVDLND